MNQKILPNNTKGLKQKASKKNISQSLRFIKKEPKNHIKLSVREVHHGIGTQDKYISST